MNQKNATAYQIINYISIFKAQCKCTMYKGHKIKKYEVPNSDEQKQLLSLRKQLQEKMHIA